MLEKGKINTDEAIKLLDLIEKPEASINEPVDSVNNKRRPKYLRVVVEPGKSEAGADTEQVNIRVPMALLYAGVKLTSLIPDQAIKQVNTALGNKGINMDLRKIKPENLAPLVDALNDMEVEVNSKKEKVHVFVE